LNLLVAVYLLGDGVLTAVTKTPAEVHQASIDFYKAAIQDPQTQKTMVDSLKTGPADRLHGRGAGTVGGGIFLLIISLLTLIGGIRMTALKSYGLAITGAIVAAIRASLPRAAAAGGSRRHLGVDRVVEQ